MHWHWSILISCMRVRVWTDMHALHSVRTTTTTTTTITTTTKTTTRRGRGGGGGLGLGGGAGRAAASRSSSSVPAVMQRQVPAVLGLEVPQIQFIDSGWTFLLCYRRDSPGAVLGPVVDMPVVVQRHMQSSTFLSWRRCRFLWS